MDELVKRLREIHPEEYDDEWEFAYDCQRAMDEAADAIEELSKPRWIPTTERLPEENALCLVFNKDYGPMVGWRIDGERFRIPGSRFPDHPTHWMPLPELPKEE